jgi:phage terminase large subunit-like protein
MKVRCSRNMSMSGITERNRTRATLIFTFKALADPAPRMYPSAKCPTAKRD